MGRMTYIWGEDAEEFRPERWINNGVFQPESPSKFAAFQAPSICLGKEFAYRQMKILAAALLFFFKFRLADEKKEAAYRTMFTLHIDNGLHLFAFPRILSAAALATAFALLAILVLKILPQKSSGKQKKYPPIVSTVFHELINFHRLHDYIYDLACKHRTYRLLNVTHSEIHTSDPTNLEHVLKTNFANYGKGTYHYDVMTDLLGDGIFTVDGDKWRQQRKLASHGFSTYVLRDFCSSVFKENAVKVAQIIQEAASSNQTVDVQDLFTKSSMETVFKTIMGVELDSMYGKNEEAVRFCRAFDEASALTLYRYADVLWRIKKFLNIGSEAKLSKSIKEVDDYVYQVIERKIEQANTLTENTLKKKGDILSRFLELKENNDPKFLRDITLSFIVAGKESSALALSWLMCMLCKHPQVQEKIAEEVREAANIKEDSTLEEIVASLSEEALDRMQYLHAALTESLRLYPAVPVDAKLCFSDDTLPDGFSVRKGDLVVFSMYAMGRLKSLWGDDAEDFRPERWLNENGIFQSQSPFKFTAFQGGPRICLGKDFAYRQMKIVSAILFSSFKFKLRDDQKAIKYRTMLTLHINGGLHVSASPRLAQRSTRDR
ncbi:Cytochrome P450 [Dillenia turbinata]|uniref:Cytochrome P450 n=1 Tax=Dillenia turbinata TaxID=194707 RepID=A0AAN8VR51_9MAGN